MDEKLIVLMDFLIKKANLKAKNQFQQQFFTKKSLIRN